MEKKKLFVAGLRKRSLYSNRYSILLTAGMVFCSFPLSAAVVGVGSDERPSINEMAPEAMIDEVDPSQGNLVVRQRDLMLPGDGGLDIEVWRSYNMLSTSSALKATHNQSYKWTALGPGWTLGVAPVLRFRNNYVAQPPNTTGAVQPVEYTETPIAAMCRGAFLGRPFLAEFSLQHPDGRTEALTGTEPYRSVTQSNWMVECKGENITAVSPAGVTYDFGSYSERRIGMFATSISDSITVATGSSGIPGLVLWPSWSDSYLVAKSASSLTGNRLDYTYKQHGSPIAAWAPGRSTEPGSFGTMEASKYESPSLLLAGVSSSDGRSVNFNYDEATGRLVSMTDSAGRSWSYSYVAASPTTSVSLSQVILPTGRVWGFGYNSGPYVGGETANLRADHNPRKLSSITYPEAGVVNYEYGFYDITGRLTDGSSWSQTRIAGERVVKRTLSTGESWSYAYTRGGSGEYDTTDVTGPDGTISYKFMGAGFAMNTNAGDLTSFQDNYWRIGSLMSKVYSAGNSESYNWQPRKLAEKEYYFFDLGKVRDQHTWVPDIETKSIIRDGATYSSQYSSYDIYGNAGTVTDTGQNGGSRTTLRTFFNDPAKWIIGKVQSETFPDSTLSRTFDANGNTLTETRNGVTTSYTYDGQGNIATKTLPGGGVYTYSNYKLGIPQTEVQPEGITRARVVDAAGNITSETNGEGHTTTYTYDGLNRVTSITPPLGSVQRITYTATSKTKVRGTFTDVTQYDPFGRVSSITRGGLATTYTYDAYGRVSFTSDPNASTGTSYQYDVLGRVINATNADGTVQSTAYGPATRTVTDERGKATTYTYRSYGDPGKRFLTAINAPDPTANVVLTRDSQDRVTSVTQGAFTRTYGYNANGYLSSVNNPETGDTLYGRDITGNMVSSQTGTSGVTTYTYDALNRQTAITYPSGTPSIKRTYDKTGNLLTSSSSGGIRSFAYNAVGFETQERLSIDGKLFKLSYAYDGNDRLRSATYSPSGRVIEYTPDVLGRPTTVSGYVDKATYWPNGMIKRITYTNGTVTSFGQTARLWPSFFTTETTAGTEYLKSAYSYDGVGNLLGVNDFIDNNMDRTLAYDDVNRLVGANGFWGIGTLTYDGVGNLMQQTFGSSSLSYGYDAQNRLAAVAGQRVANLGYDAYGNVSSSGGNTYTYDDVPNLVCVNCGNAASKVEYQYDGLNQRSSVISAGNKIYEMQDSDGKLRMELDGDTLTEYFYLGDQRVAQRVSP